jgi:hypothetical protein
MNNRHRKTLQTLYALPTVKSLAWEDLDSLLVALGAEALEGEGSRVKFVVKGRIIRFHRPHKPKTARAYQVELAREFLESMEITS